MEISLPKKPDLTEVPSIIEKLRKENKKEHLYFVKQSKAFVWFEGHKNYVSPLPEQLMRMNNALVLHNHIDGTSFSFEDVEAVSRYNAKELMVICRNRTYSIKRTGNKWAFSFERKKDYIQYQDSFREANSYIDELVGERKLEEVERNDFINHITWRFFFAKFEIEYKAYGL